jgi:hypothetical protein
MKLLTQAFILEKFGPRLTMAQLATLLCQSEGTIRNQVSAECFPIPTYKEMPDALLLTMPSLTTSTRCRQKPANALQLEEATKWKTLRPRSRFKFDVNPTRQSHELALRWCYGRVCLAGREIKHVYDRASDVFLP